MYIILQTGDTLVTKGVLDMYIISTKDGSKQHTRMIQMKTAEIKLKAV